MAIWLLAALIEAPRLTPSLEQYVRHTHRDRNVHRELRIMAANVAGAHGNQGDADSIERTVRTDLDPTTEGSRCHVKPVSNERRRTRPRTAGSGKQPGLKVHIQQAFRALEITATNHLL